MIGTGRDFQALEKFAWRPFKTRNGGTGAINENGRRVYGAQAQKALAPTKPGKTKNTATVYKPTARDLEALNSSQEIIGRIKTGQLTFPELVAHVDGLKLSTPGLIRHARQLGSKAPIRNKSDALIAIHDAIRAHRPKGSPIRYAEYPMKKEGCDCTALGEPKLVSIPDVEIFATGEHRDKPYTHDDLEQVVRNFSVLSGGSSPPLIPPVVVGHEEDQSWLQDTGIPAAGRVNDVWTSSRPCPTCKQSGKTPEGEKCLTCFGTGQQGVLHGAFTEVPALIGKLIKQRAYRAVSSELYDDYEDQGKHYGVALRRVALLGGELPQVKSLEQLPALAEFSDGKGKTSVVTYFPAKSRVHQGPDGKWYFPGMLAISKFCEGDKKCGACRAKKFSAQSRPKKFCQTGENAGKPGPCPGVNASKTIHFPGQSQGSKETVYHRPHQTPVRNDRPEPAVYHKPGEANALGKPEIRHTSGDGPDLAKAIRGLGQVGGTVAGGAARLAVGAGKLAAKGLWGLTKNVLAPLARKGAGLIGKGLRKLKASEDAGKELVKVIRMAEEGQAKHEGRNPSKWSDEQILNAGNAFILRYCQKKIEKFCMEGQNAGKPGPCPGEDGKGKSGSGVMGAARKVGAAAKAAAAKAIKAGWSAVPKTDREVGDSAIHAGVGWDQSLVREIRQKHGAIPAAVGGAAYTALNWATKPMAALHLIAPGGGTLARMGVLSAIRKGVATAVDSAVKEVAGMGKKFRNVKPVREIRMAAARAAAVIGGKKAAKAVLRAGRNPLKPADAVVGLVMDVPEIVSPYIGKAVSAAASGASKAASAVGRAYNRVPPVMRGFSETDLMGHVREVVKKLEAFQASKAARPPRQFSDDQIRHACQVLAV